MDQSEYTPEYVEGCKALHGGRPADALPGLARVPPSSPCWIMAQGNIGLALLQLDRNEEAEVQLRQVLSELDVRPCPHPPARLQYMRNLGEAVGKQRRWSEASAEFELALIAADEMVGQHPSLKGNIMREKAYVLNSLGTARLQLGLHQKAADAFNEARALFRQHPDSNRTGHAEVLTNLATALTAVGRQTEAGLALEEALDILEHTRDYDQLFRTLIVAIRIGSNLVKVEHAVELIHAGAEDALQSNRVGTAYLRYCEGASFLLQSGGEIADVQRMVRCARALENQLNTRDPHVPKLRLFEAMACRSAGEPQDAVIRLLIEGAYHWYELLAAPLIPADFLATTSDLHLHFRILAGCLAEVGRTDESLMAFDAGRGLGYAVATDPTLYTRIPAQNPFSPDGSAVDISQLRTTQQSMTKEEVSVVLAVIPPRVLAFVVCSEQVECVAVDIPSTPWDLERLSTECNMTPQRLAQGADVRAIPPPLLVLSKRIAQHIGSRTVRAFVPYDALHMIPWRAVLRHCGVSWQQLPFGLGFYLTLRSSEASRQTFAGSTVVALGHGLAGTVNLEDEAESFAAVFGADARLVSPATMNAVRESLQSQTIVLLSCHGKTVYERGDLRLELSDGQALGCDVFPTNVRTRLVILSACESGVYFMAWSDFPVGAAPMLIRRGAEFVIGARFPVRAMFASDFFTTFAQFLAAGNSIGVAFATTLAEAESRGADHWQDLACLELVEGGRRADTDSRGVASSVHLTQHSTGT